MTTKKKRKYPHAATTFRVGVLCYLEPPKATALDRLSKQTRIPKAVLLREAVDDLLQKHAVLRRAK